MYDPDALDALKMEKELTDATDGQLADALLTQNASRAALSIVQLATTGTNENTKLRAAVYIVDRVLGPMEKGLKRDADNDALAALVQSIVVNNDASQSRETA
jgi:hypothetical protein